MEDCNTDCMKSVLEFSREPDRTLGMFLLGVRTAET